MTKFSRKRRKQIVLLLFVVGLLFLIAAVVGLIDYFNVTGQGGSMPDTKIVSSSTENPSEKDPGEISDDYIVPSDQPRAILIPALGVEGYIQRVGIGKDNIMSAPSNIFYAGWYVGSVAPGEKGLSIIDGHAGGRYEEGIFRHLVDVKRGDGVLIQMGDKTWREFMVESSKIYSVEESAKALMVDDPTIDRELRLITCDGVFDDRKQTYDKRLIVKLSLKGDSTD